ncbi:MAG TPA: hypothetical protein V6C96_05330, partial [Vampirovibrionales bacterium]
MALTVLNYHPSANSRRPIENSFNGELPEVEKLRARLTEDYKKKKLDLDLSNTSAEQLKKLDIYSKEGLPLMKLPKAILKTITEPGKAGINGISWVTNLLPLIFAPTLFAGLTSRSISDIEQKDHKEPAGWVKALRDIYPTAYSFMMLCGVLNGISYASVSRILSYSLLFLGSLFVMDREKHRNEALGIIADSGLDP